MSITLTTDYGEFTAETEQEVLSASRKAKRDAERERKRVEEAQSRATELAYREAYRILDRYTDEGETPRGWRYHLAGTQYASIKVEALTDHKWRLTITGVASGPNPVRDFWFMEPFASVEGGSGCTMAVYFRDKQGDVTCYAMAGYDGEIGMVGIVKKVADWLAQQAK